MTYQADGAMLEASHEPHVVVEPLENVAYVYDGSTEGLLTAVFQTYVFHEQPQDILREGALQPRLWQSVRVIATDDALAHRVQVGVCKRAGRQAWEAVLHASLSDDPSAGMAVWRFIRYVMARPVAQNRKLVQDLAHPIAGPVAKLSRSVMNERHLMQQFIRFEHFENDVWFARCNPKANVVPLLMDWFAGRFNTQRFVVYDEVHNVAGIYDGEGWYLAQTGDVHLPLHAQDEATMQAAWKGFYDAVAIPARYHPELRRHFMPKRFWRNIVEVRDELPETEQGELLEGGGCPSGDCCGQLCGNGESLDSNALLDYGALLGRSESLTDIVADINTL